MPTWRKRDSIPKVRASSGTIGTRSLVSSFSLSRPLRIPTKAAVVEAGRPPEPSVDSLKDSIGGVAIDQVPVLRDGMGPPIASRRDIRYCISGDSAGGL